MRRFAQLASLTPLCFGLAACAASSIPGMSKSAEARAPRWRAKRPRPRWPQPLLRRDPMRIAGLGQDESAKPCAERLTIAD